MNNTAAFSKRERKNFLNVFLDPFAIFRRVSRLFLALTYRKSISVECAERFSPDKSSLSLFGKLLTIVVGRLFPRRDIKRIEHDHS